MTDAYIIDGIRTPIGNIGGALSAVRPDDMAALVIGTIVTRNPSIDRERIADVVMGCANQAGEDNRNVARMAVLLAGLPVSVPGVTINRLCASGLNAVAIAANNIKAGEGDLYIAGGVESMTRAPYVMSKGATPFARDVQLFDTSLGWRFVNPKMKPAHGTHSMGETAENVAEKYAVSRADQDAFAAWSQQKAARAQREGRLAEEIVAVEIPQRKGDPTRVTDDEFLRPDTTVETLARLKPAFRTDGQGSVTAGNSSGLNDGAAALLIASSTGVRDFGLTPLARVVSTAAAGVPSHIMGMGPVPASKLALERAGLSLADMSVIEINEAFAAQAVASARELGLPDHDDRLNPNGGAIALGHPLGMSGARIALAATRELHRRGGRYALCSMCIGVGQGFAVVLERV